MSEKVLITGASGFLGYHIVKAAIEQGLDIYGAIRKNSDIEHLRGLPIQYLYLDYNDVDGLTTQLRENKIVYIIHAAGITKALNRHRRIFSIEAEHFGRFTYTVEAASRGCIFASL